MKKNFKILIFIFVFLFSLAACQAKFTEINTVTFITNSTDKDFTVECDVLEEPKNELSKIGHDFDGWYFDSSFERKVTFPYDVDDNIVIYGKWNPKKYIVSFETNGGNTISSLSVEYGNTFIMPENPTKENFEFKGWYSDSQFNTIYESQAVTSDLTLYAKWEEEQKETPVVKYTVTFDVDGVKTNSQIVANSKVVKPENPSKDGYTFGGWLLEGNIFDFDTLVNGDITLVASWEINSYKVTFDVDGTKTTVNVDYNKKLERPDNPSKEGHTFKCWTLNGDEYDFDTAIKSDLILVASFEINTYAVIFNVEGSETTINAKYNELATKPIDPVKEGYTFIGWILNEEVFDFDTPIKNDVILLASFEINKYTVTFDVDGTTTTQKVEHNQKATKPENPYKEGHNFVYWSVDGDEYDFDILVTGDITLVALFSLKPYIVTFDVNGYIYTNEVEQGNTLPKPTDPELYGHRFICWELNNEEYDFSKVLTSDITLVAKFEQIVCIVTFDIDGVKREVEVKYGSYVAEPTEIPEKEGHTFSGWLLDNNVYYFNEMITEDITLVAGFDINTYIVTFIVESGVTKEISVTYNETVEHYVPELSEGYQFDGWFLDGEKFDFTTPIKSDIKLYGFWSKITYMISFELCGGIGTNITIVDYGKAISLPANPTRDGFTFEGWYLDSSYLEEYINQLIYEDTILYAKWATDLDAFIVSFVDDDGYVLLNVDVIENEKVSIPTLIPEKYGHTFKCWTLDGEEYDFDSSVTSNLTLKTSWDVIVCFVTFDIDGIKTTLNINYGDVLQKPEDPTKVGHLFNYWECNSLEFNAFNLEVTSDFTLTAVFIPINYAITFDCDNAQYIYSSADYGTKITKPEQPTREGHTFVCWTFNGEEYDFDTLVTGEMTLVAKWEANTYTVTFDIDSVETEVEVKYGQYVAEPEMPTKEGHNFSGWLLNDETYNFNLPITENITLTASWTRITYNIILYNEGNEYVNETIYYGEEFTLPENPTPNTGYYFAGWVKNDGSEEYVEDSFIVKADVSAYAHYIAIEYTLTFILDGGEEPEVRFPVFTIETPTYQIYPVIKEGYTFLGWTSETVTEPVEIYTIEQGTTGDLVLTANWEIKVYTVTFELNGGSSVESINVNYNNTFELPKNPTKQNYEFAGWYTDSNLTEAYIKEAVKGSFTLYAKWTEMASNPEYTYMWYFDGSDVTYSNEASFTGSIQNKTDEFEGLTVDATVSSGKLAYNSKGYSQVNQGTTITFTVSSAAVVTVISYSGQYNYKINGVAATGNTTTFEVNAGDVVFEATSTAYIYSISYILDETSSSGGAEEEPDDEEIKAINLGFNAVIKSSSNTTAGNGVYYNNTVQQIYKKNSTLNLSYLTVTAIDFDDNQIVLSESEYTVSNFDSTTAGEKIITISYGGKSATFSVWVVDTEISIVDEIAKVMVDADYTGTIGAISNGYNMFNKVQQALDFIKISNLKSTISKELYICSGTYKEKLEISIPKLTIIGENVANTIIEWDSLYGIKDESGFAHTTDSTQTIAIREEAVNCTIRNLTISNYYNSLNAFDSVFGEGYSEHRALALLVQADKLIMDNCKLLGYQDTLELMTGRQYIINSYICGTTDFIFGTNNTTYFYNCQIHSIDAESNRGTKSDGGYITAFKGMNKGSSDSIVYGVIFDNCDFTADTDVLADGNTAIARPWGAYSAVMVMNSSLGAHISKTENTSGTLNKNVRYAIMNDNNIATTATLQFFEYNNKGSGAITTSQKGVTVITDSTIAGKYNNLDTIFGKTNGNLAYSDAWNPTKTNVVESYNITFGSSGNYKEFMDLDWIDLSNIKIGDNGGNNSQVKEGTITIQLNKGAVLTINSFNGYTSYKLSDGTTTTDTITGTIYSYTAEADVRVSITPQSGNNYFYSIVIDNSGVEVEQQEVTLSSITASGMTTSYAIGDTLDLSNMVVTAIYSNGSTKILSISDYEINSADVDMNTAGIYEIDVIYNEKYYTFNIIVSENTINVMAFAGYNEGAYIEFNSNGFDASDYNITYSLANSSSTIEVDSKLLRKTNDIIRCDILGLSAGTYSITVTNNETAASTTKSVSVTAYDRSGYAHFNNTTGVGAYNNDGTLKSNALVVYVNDSNKNTVTATIAGKTYTDLANILKNQSKSSNPLVIRIIGRVGAATWNSITYSGSSLSADSITGANGTVLTKEELTEAEIISAGFNTLNTTTVTILEGLTNKISYKSDKNQFDSYFNMLDISSASNVTIEGVGTDAEIFQWGFTWKNCNSIEVRNLTFTGYPEDACSFQGGSNSDVNTYGNYWVHNNTFNKGNNNWDVTYEQDKPAGDGATDFKYCNSITSSYNKFNNCKKTGLVGGDNKNYTRNVTFHHNYYNEVGSRLPLGRQANMHIYNNYYYKCSTAQDIRANAFVLSEANYFENCSSPQKVTTDSTYTGTVIKSFGDYLTGCGNSQATIVTSRTQSLSGNCKPDGITDYTNFDTNSSLFYYDSVNQKSNVALLTDAATAKIDCINLAGVLKN